MIKTALQLNFVSFIKYFRKTTYKRNENKNIYFSSRVGSDLASLCLVVSFSELSCFLENN